MELFLFISFFSVLVRVILGIVTVFVYWGVVFGFRFGVVDEVEFEFVLGRCYFRR